MNQKVIENINGKTILVAALNWGQGHVYRLIPILKQLQNQGNNIHIACDSSQQNIFSFYLHSETQFHYLKGYKFKFSTKKSILGSNFFQFPDLLKQHGVDYKTCERLVKDLQINLVLSDHRYGFFSKKVPSIFLTHQCQLPTKNKWVQKLHHRFINTNFQSVWVFDTENHSFAHELSDTKNIEPPVSYLGAVSRFENYLPSTKDKHVAVISGPKPYNENLLLFVQKYAEENQLTIHCITQLAFESPYLIPVLLEQQDLILSQANTFISHIGYTTLMDLHYLNPKDVLLIPSPNQLEQEYLAKQYASKYNITITKPYSQSK